MAARQSTQDPQVHAAALARKLALEGDALYERERIAEAFELFSRSVELQPLQPAYHYRLASAAWKLNRSDLVEKHYLQAIRLNPGRGEAHRALAQWHLARKNIGDALHHSARALELDGQDIDTVGTRIVVLIAHDQPLEAWELLGPIIDSGSNLWHVAIWYARVAPKIGREAHAAERLERALAEPNLPNSHKAAMHYARAELLDKLGRYDEAFEQARVANALARRPYDPAAYSRWISRQIDYFTPRRMRSLPRATHGNSRPVLIVGMPRSGTTLVEQILASHREVFGGDELQLLGNIAGQCASPAWAPVGASYPECFDHLSINIANQLASGYLQGITAINESARYVTDKMPHNFEHLALASVILPESRIIHCHRDPRDTCLSNYFTDFSEGNLFSFDLDHLASHFRDYHRLMEHWKSVVSVPILDVRYEDLIADAPGQTRRLLEFLDLEWDDNCLAFHKTQRHVSTASWRQVRQPIYASSVARWRHYARHIPQLLSLAAELGTKEVKA